jgi:hypothetical protein
VRGPKHSVKKGETPVLPASHNLDQYLEMYKEHGAGLGVKHSALSVARRLSIARYRSSSLAAHIVVGLDRIERSRCIRILLLEDPFHRIRADTRLNPWATNKTAVLPIAAQRLNARLGAMIKFFW